MRHDSRLSYAIAAILGVQTAGVHAADTTGADQSRAPARRRAEIVGDGALGATENLQDVPIAITAITAETLTQLNVQTFDDFVKYLPNVSTASNGPGINEIYMRGLSTTQGGSQGGGGINSFPNVAVYLDDQSAQLPAAISTSMRPISSASKSWRARRARCTARARRRARPIYHQQAEAR